MELLMKPVEQMSSMATLDFTPSLSNGDRALPLPLQAVALFLQEDISQHGQRPEPHDGDGAHQLILIQAQFFLAIAKEDFDIPTRCDVQEQCLRAGFHITGSPIACLRERGIQRLPHDHHLAMVQAAHPCCHNVHVHRLVSFGPGQLDIVALAQLSRVLRHALPLPAFGCTWVCDGEPAIALDPSCDQKLPLPCGSPEAFGTVPAIKQDMRLCSGDWLKCADGGFHQLDLALEGHAFHFADLLLSIHLGSQGTASPQEHIQTLDQAMTGHALVFGRRMMPAQSLHLLGFALVYRRVIPNQIPCHDGCFGTASTLGLPLALSLELCCHLWLHLFPEMPQPAFGHGCLFPRRFRQKATQSRQTGSIRNLLQQTRERSCPFAEHQPQQYGHEVLVLGVGEHLPKAFCKVAYLFVQTYNGYRHRTPPWIQGCFFFLNTTWCSFLLPSFKKCKHRDSPAVWYK